MVARINHEKAEREKLEQQRQELVKRKSKLIADNKRRRDDLTNLDKDLEKFIDVRPPFLFPKIPLWIYVLTYVQASKPIQKIFEKNP